MSPQCSSATAVGSRRIVPEEDAWVYSPAWQEKLREADADLAAGRVQQFEDDDEFLAHLDALADEAGGWRYWTTVGFDTALAKLPREHRRLFAYAVRGHLISALAAGAHRGEAPWPKRLRIHKIGEVVRLPGASQADGRALFTIGPDTDGEPLLTWLAVGYHDIYQ